MKRIIAVALFAFSASLAAQPGWNWPEDKALYDQAQEKQAYYKVLMGQSKFDESLKPLLWLYKNNPNLNASIYIDGVKSIEEVLEVEKDAARVTALEDSILWMYDQRIKYFGNEGKVLNRKSYSAFRLYYKKPPKYPLVMDLYAKTYEVNGVEVERFNHVPYMTMAIYYHKRKPDEMPGEKVLEVLDLLTDIIDKQLKAGEDLTKLKGDQDKIDALIASVDGLLSCDYIENTLVPRFKANPDDVNTAKKIVSYSLKAKCADQDYFLEAGEAVVNLQPTVGLAMPLADRRLARKEYDQALKLYEKVLSMAETDEQRYEALIGQSKAYARKGLKSKSRQLAYDALELKPGAAEAYNIIGNLYYTSFDNCKGGISKVKDRAVFFVAYEAYRKAGNASQMAACQAQFPSIDEIFNEGYEEGQKITVGCWINDSGIIARRR